MIEYLFGGAIVIVLFRLFAGPTFADRVLSVEVVMNIIVFFTVYYSVFHNPSFIDVAIVIAILSFLGNIAVAKYVIK